MFSSRLRVSALALVLLFCVSSVVTVRAQTLVIPPTRVTTCEQGMNVILVLDGSGSIDEIEFQDQRVFALELVKQFGPTQSGTHIGIIQFGSTGTVNVATVFTQLTGNAAQLETTLTNMAQIGGQTPIGLGLSKAFELLQADISRLQALPTIVLLTDGASTDNPNPIVAQLRAARVSVFGVAVGDQVNVNALNNIVTQPPEFYSFGVQNFQRLQSLVQEIIELTCFSVIEVTGDGCASDVHNVTIIGSGFRFPNLFCKFTINDREIVVKGEFGEDPAPTVVQCLFPGTDDDDDVPMDIQLDGIWLNTGLYYDPDDCDGGLPWWAILLIILAALLLLALLAFLLWKFCMRRQAQSYKGSAGDQLPRSAGPPGPEVFAPAAGGAAAGAAAGGVMGGGAPPGGFKWEVQGSKYIWGRDGGGARPMTVQYGKLGATESAPHMVGDRYVQMADETELPGAAPSGYAGSTYTEHGAPAQSDTFADVKRRCGNCVIL